MILVQVRELPTLRIMIVRKDKILFLNVVNIFLIFLNYCRIYIRYLYNKCEKSTITQQVQINWMNFENALFKCNKQYFLWHRLFGIIYLCIYL